MGRRPHHHDRAFVTVELPRRLIDLIDAFADKRDCNRPDAMKRLLWRGWRASVEDVFDAAMRQALRP